MEGYSSGLHFLWFSSRNPGLDEEGGHIVSVGLSRQCWRTPCGRSEPARRLLWMAPMKVLANHAGAVSGEEERGGICRRSLVESRDLGNLDAVDEERYWVGDGRIWRLWSRLMKLDRSRSLPVLRATSSVTRSLEVKRWSDGFTVFSVTKRRGLLWMPSDVINAREMCLQLRRPPAREVAPQLMSSSVRALPLKPCSADWNVLSNSPPLAGTVALRSPLCTFG